MSGSEPGDEAVAAQHAQQEGDAAADAAVGESSASSPLTTAQILTADSIGSLVSGLDASDVLECYYLSRLAETTASSGSTSGASASIPFGIPKVALGLRYRQSASASSTGSNHYNKLKPQLLELTLEYGPLRIDAGNNHESIPRIVVSQQQQQSQDDASVVWENEGRIYYTNHITDSTFTSANYVASMTGAVLYDLLQFALAYPTAKSSHRRYQPLTVVLDNQNDTETGAAVVALKSSSDVDFVQALFQHLALVGVELHPVLLPPKLKLQLHAQSIERILTTESAKPDVSVQQIGTQFWTRLYDCVHAIASANYSKYEPPQSTVPTVAPSWPTAAAGPPRLMRQGQVNGAIQDAVESIKDQQAKEPTSPTTIGTNSTSPSSAPSVDPKKIPQKQVENAEKAAQEAQDAADAAQDSGNEQAAQAAQAAATAAQKAAQSTKEQAAQMAQQKIHSNHGETVLEAVRLCFSSPQFGIATSNESVASSSTPAYLYWDGVYFFHAELVPPYLSITQEAYKLPRPPQYDDSSGDYVDWTLALVVLLFSLFGLLLLLQHVMGRSLRIMRPLYKFQRRFFDPMQHHHILDDDSDLGFGGRGGLGGGRGKQYTFAEDVIPLSMGGRMPDMHDMQEEFGSKAVHGDWMGENGSDDDLAEVELVATSNDPYHRRRSSASNADLRRRSFSDDLLDMDDSDNVGSVSQDHPRFMRDPDMVDHPSNLTSKSKVAVPVSVGRNSGSLHTSDSSVLGDDP